MSLQFVRDKPLQACKLVAIVGTLLFAAGGVFGLAPGRGLGALLFTTAFSLVLALVIAAETLLAGYRVIRADGPLARRFDVYSVYTVVRGGEAVVATLAAGVFVVAFATVTAEPMAGPGAIGLLFFGVALGLLILVASLVRTLAEYYFHRRNYVA